MSHPADDLEPLTAATQSGDAGEALPDGTQQLRESWSAFSQLLAEADRQMSPPSLAAIRLQLDEQRQQQRQYKARWLGGVVVAAGIAAGVIASVVLTPPQRVEFPKEQPQIVQAPAIEDAPPWDDQWDTALAFVQATVLRCHALLLMPTQETALLQARLDWLEAECESETL